MHTQKSDKASEAGKAHEALSRPTVVDHLGNYLIHLIIATFGAMVLGLVPAVPFGMIYLLFSDRPRIFNTLAGVLADSPLFVLPVLAGLFLGYFMYRRIGDRGALFVWVLPLLGLIYSISEWRNYSSWTWRQDVWNNFFSGDCGESECLYAFTATAPFYTSVAYALGALYALMVVRRVIGPRQPDLR